MSTGSDPDLLALLCEQAEAVPDRTLYIELLDGTNESDRLTARQLRDGAAAVAEALTAAGLGSGDVALLMATKPVEFLVGLFGCMWAGVIAAPIASPRRPEHLQTRVEPVRANAGAVAVVAGTPQGDGERAVLEQLASGIPVVSVEQPEPAELPPLATDRDVAYLQYTSGSTSEPRGVIVTHSNLIANLNAAAATIGYEEEMVNVSWCPLTHDMGLIMGALPSVAFGCTSVLMPPVAFIRRPLAWLRAIDRYRGTHGYAPNFGYDLCVDRSTPEDRARLDLSSMRVFVNGAETVRDRTRDRFVEAFAVAGLRPEAHTPAYGLAESTVLVTASDASSSGLVVFLDGAALERNEVVLVSEGTSGARALCGDGPPAPGYDVRIVDPETAEPAPPGRVAEVWIAGPSVCQGYWRRPEETEHFFGARIAGESGGPYLRTGDLGFMHDDQLIICGRAKDLVVIHGRNIHPQDVEQIAEFAHPAIRVGAAAAFAIEAEGGEALVIIAEVDGEPDTAEVTVAISAAVMREFELHVADVLLLGPQQTPKTTSGKKQRAASRELWSKARGEHAVGV
jgi:acyl-CoA synthetase (AMP-forming)/AMP-acid ligase II